MQKKYYTHFEKHYTRIFYKHNFSKDAKAPNPQQNKHNAKHIPSLWGISLGAYDMKKYNFTYV